MPPSTIGSDPFRLDGTTALVIGGAGVLGAAIASGLAAAGASVAITSRTISKASGAAARIAAESGGRVEGHALDASDPRAVEAAADAVEETMGPIAVLVNAAGGNAPGGTVAPGARFDELDAEGIRAVIDMNLHAGAVVPCQVVGGRMARRGRPASIINVASMAAERPLTRVAAYGASKAAVVNLTKWLAVHYAKDLGVPVRANALAPGFFLTEQNRFLLTEDGDPARLTARGRAIVDHTPMGRFGDPADLAGAAVWLAGPASRFVTGAVIPVDGGFSAFSGV